MHPENEFKSISHIFVCLGLATVQPYFRSDSQLHNVFLIIPTIIQSLVILLEVCISMLYPEEFILQETDVTKFTDVVQLFGILSAGTIQILENVSKSRIDQSIKESIENFDRDIFTEHHCRRLENCAFCKKRFLRPFLITRAFYLVIVSFTMDAIVVITLDDEEKHWRQSLLARRFTANMIRIGLLHIVCHFHWVNIHENLK